MRILYSALPLLFLLSGCATVDGEPVASESVVADAATRNSRAGHADKKYQNPIEMIRQGVQAGDEAVIEKGRAKLISMLSETHLSPAEKFMDILLGGGVVHTAQRNAQKIAADIIAYELQRPGSTAGPSVEEAVRLGLIQPQELIPGLQIQEDYARLIPGAGLTPLQYEVVKSRQANLSKSVWPGEEAQETTSNQRDETSDFYQTQSDQQQYSVFQQPQQLIPTPGGRALLGPITPNAYGPGLNSDATGRSFMWTPQFGGSGDPDPTLRVQPNAYGPGIGMDQYGRPVRPACPPGMLC
jgi:hypothetical protein